MRSDLASMAQTGGGSPRFENVRLSKSFTEQQSGGNASSDLPRKNKSDIVLIVSLVVVFLAIVVVGWFLYKKFSAVAPASQATSAQGSTASSSPSQAQSGLITVPTTTP
jgi:flagellar basal body-associated protein FliL